MSKHKHKNKGEHYGEHYGEHNGEQLNIMVNRRDAKASRVTDNGERRGGG